MSRATSALSIAGKPLRLFGLTTDIYQIVQCPAIAGPMPEGVRVTERDNGDALRLSIDVDGVEAAHVQIWSGPTYPARRGYFLLAPDEAEVSLLETRPEYRGRGLGSGMLRAVCAMLAARGFRHGWGRIWHSNIASVKSCARAGWSFHGVRVDIHRPGFRRVIHFPRMQA